ncbi:hypothetical protein [Pseudorhodobacter aquimaris]|uniref:hypothetical protein n=1 Tax=Pseudorhodobacter aquimaris TaxID=687412 RepID=UPI000AE30866|nr:hypothetical protein [Pseudorhodobacter aquimaris]
MITTSLFRRILNWFKASNNLSAKDRAALIEHRDIWLGKQSIIVANAGRHYSF